jgi:hypothetical protein
MPAGLLSSQQDESRIRPSGNPLSRFRENQTDSNANGRNV